MKKNRISLYKVDRYLIDDLNESEKLTVQNEINENQDLKSYIEQANNLHSSTRFDAIESQIHNNSFFNKLNKYFTSKIFLQFQPSLISTAFALVLICIIGGTTIFLQQNHDQKYLGVKGTGTTELFLLTGGKSYSPGQEMTVHENDTISFLYRSPEKMHVYLFYCEDDGSVEPFSTPGSHLVWDRSPSAQVAPLSIELEGTWKKQIVWVVTSNKKISVNKARTILNNKANASAKVYAFYMVR